MTATAGNPIAFYVVAIVAVAAALGVVTFRNAIFSMLSLILNLLMLAFFFLMLNALFVATIQVLIYAGAVMVLFLFVVTMLSPNEVNAREDRLRWQWGAGVGLGIILAGSLIYAILTGSISEDARTMTGAGLATHVTFQGSTQTFGLALFHGYELPFEITGLLLVIAVLGAVALGRHLIRQR